MINSFQEYYKKAKMKQELCYQGYNWTKEDIDDDLIWNVPIYDVVNRRFAAFSSFPEALWYKSKDPKKNGKFFESASICNEDFAYLCYLFRLSGSGINYKPKTTDKPYGSHGFGNFWIVDQLKQGLYRRDRWINNIPEKGFCDVKGYLLPMIKEGLRSFIINQSFELFYFLWQYINDNNLIGIKDLVDLGNSWLNKKGYKKQNFVLTAFAMDMAEYFPEKVNRNSEVYIGTNAKKCLKLILPKVRKENEALKYLCELTGGYSKLYDMEDVACDFIRYINNFQSEHHIKNNNNIIYKNNIQNYVTQ